MPPSFDKKYKVLELASFKNLRPRMTIVDASEANDVVRLDALYARTLAKLGIMRSICERVCSTSMNGEERARYQREIDLLVADIDALAAEINDGAADKAQKPDYDNIALSLSNRMNVIESGDDGALRTYLQRRLKKERATEEKLKSWMDSLFDG